MTLSSLLTHLNTFLKRRKNQRIIAVIGLFIISATVSFALFAPKTSSLPVDNTPAPTPSVLDDRAIDHLDEDMTLPEPVGDKDYSQADTINILLLGYGGAGHQGGFLTDVILLVHLNFAHQTLNFIHIPRDMWVALPTQTGSVSTKINAALPMGLKVGNYPTQDIAKDTIIRGSYLTRYAVKYITNLDTDSVIAIDFDRFSAAINSLRGIDVQVATRLDDHWYPIKGRELELCDHTPEEVTHLSNTLSGFNLLKQFPCRFERVTVEPGTVHMDGELALKYVRSRHSSSDFDRGRRQMEVMTAVAKKLYSLQAFDQTATFFNTLSKTVKTDLSLTHAQALGPRLITFPAFTINTISLSTSNVLSSITTNTGAAALIPKAGEGNWSAIHTYIQSHITSSSSAQ